MSFEMSEMLSKSNYLKAVTGTNIKIDRRILKRERIKKETIFSLWRIIGVIVSLLFRPLKLKYTKEMAITQNLSLNNNPKILMYQIFDYCVTRAPLLYIIRSWVALPFEVVSEWVSESGIGNTCPDLHFVQYIKA